MKLQDVGEKLEAVHCDLSGSRFEDVNLAGATFTNANMSGWRVEDVTLAGTKIANANLSGVSIAHCALEGMTIEGILVSDLLAAFRGRAEGGE